LHPPDMGRERERLRDRREEQPQHAQRGHTDNHDNRRVHPSVPGAATT
jgi:hypothetical protein